MRVVRIALLVSVALNLLVAGILIGNSLDMEPHRDSRLRGVGPMAPFAAAMSPEDRSALLAGLREEGRAARPEQRDPTDRLDALLEAIRADQFDQDRLKEILAEQRGLAIARQREGERLLIDTIAAMSANERVQYAERLEATFRGARRR